ncbi:hypothetical protein Scep_002046 [Stephania cephalantha]|uniref:Amidase domain-containing protein n=1 Tax=Stephania cephalantha TaxID=152367 RepID=A0AAP0Q4B7_9MAGN
MGIMGTKRPALLCGSGMPDHFYIVFSLFLKGLVPFAVGLETAGSITYPAARRGVTALRPTFDTVRRTVAFSESLDKLGPFCRSAVDCALVLDAIRGKDPDYHSSRESLLNDPFTVDITKLTVGYLEDAEMERENSIRVALCFFTVACTRNNIHGSKKNMIIDMQVQYCFGRLLMNLMSKQDLKELGFVQGQNARALEKEIEVHNSSCGKAMMMIMGGA